MMQKERMYLLCLCDYKKYSISSRLWKMKPVNIEIHA